MIKGYVNEKITL